LLKSLFGFTEEKEEKGRRVSIERDEAEKKFRNQKFF